jgi:hypothetical protein
MAICRSHYNEISRQRMREYRAAHPKPLKPKRVRMWDDKQKHIKECRKVLDREAALAMGPERIAAAVRRVCGHKEDEPASPADSPSRE